MSKILSDSNIKEAGNEISLFLSSQKIKDDTLSQRIGDAYKSAMSVFAEKMGSDTAYELSYRKSATLLRVKLSIPGIPINPLTELEREREFIPDINSLDIQWSYKDGINYLMWSYKFTGGMSQLRQVAVAFSAALILGFLCRWTLPEHIVDYINEAIAGRLFNLFMRLLGCAAGPLVFLSIVNGIYSIGDSASFGRIGKAIIFRFIFGTFAIGLSITAVLAVCYGVAGGSVSGSNMEFLIDMIFDIVPVNIFSPFIDGNMLQIIFEACIIGIAMMYLGSKTSVVSQLIDQSRYIVSTVMKAVGSMIHVFVFLCFFRIVAGGQLFDMLHSYKLLLINIAFIVFIWVGYVVYTCLKFRIAPGLLIKKLNKPTMLGLTTASTTASLSAMYDTAENSLGISNRLSVIGISLGQVMFSTGPLIVYTIFGICMGMGYEIPMTFQFYVSAWFVSAVLSIATPPIPGAGATCFAVLIAQLGIPSEAVAICISLCVLLDYPGTAMKVSGILFELLHIAKSTDEIDVNVLTAKDNIIV